MALVQAYLNAGLNISLIDERQQPPTTINFCHAGGIQEYVGNICVGKAPLFPEPETLGTSVSKRGVLVDLALRWNSVSVMPITRGPLQRTLIRTLTLSRESPHAVWPLASHTALMQDMYTDNIISFANGVHTPNGGSHVDGLKAAITRVLNSQENTPQPAPNVTPPSTHPRELPAV